MVSFAKQSGAKEITLLADIKVGRYAWAKLGFDYADKNQLGFAIRWLEQYCKKNKIEFPKAAKENIKTAKDVAEFEIEGKKIRGMEIGKSFMLSMREDGHGSWDGVLKL
jgi:ribosomal protein L3